MIKDFKRILFERGIKIKDPNRVHLAIVNEPFLSYIENGEKTIESRFTKNRITPYRNIQSGDAVFMKEAGRPVQSFFTAKDSQFFENNPEIFEYIKRNFAEQICARDESFWEIRKDKNYISLVGVDSVEKIDDLKVDKKDKRAWLTFENAYKNILLTSCKIGSGKTYVAQQLAQMFQYDQASFSSYIRYKSEKMGLELTRENMQKIGHDTVENDLDSYIYFMLNCAVDKKSDTLILDGLRNTKVLDSIRQENKGTRVIYVECDETLRQQQLTNRDGSFNPQSDAHETEQEMERLKKLADVVVKNTDDPKEINRRINQSSGGQISLFDVADL